MALTVLLSLPPAHALRAGGQGQHVPLDSAVSRIREQQQGRVLSAETLRQNGREVHRIRVLTPDGRVRELHVDPRTGNVK